MKQFLSAHLTSRQLPQLSRSEAPLLEQASKPLLPPPETISTSVEETTTVSKTNVEVVIPPIPTVTITRTLSVSTVHLYRPNQKREASLDTVLASLEKKYSKSAVTAGCS
ncbi:hypothetical protein FPSE_06853 [Fusarium pseudograminearum CS3096]|uniref:Uncharacterized protein n=1 Tax=Fusarium pseudograminearum (strain CS3096) TaxID=1028729 RepID=K3VFJ8_FUSPC|nr:hypothetical protein FPSE_06853 [Fusarium pseudograminearum CS3096]EKJ72957.1 hypothetical protein FPSE_06853 [Fusarium pseudograminearum CS3096]